MRPGRRGPKRIEEADRQLRGFGADDHAHRAKLRRLLRDRRWHTQREMLMAGGLRYPSRVDELRRRDLLDVAVRSLGRGAYEYRLRGRLERPPDNRPTWRRRALAAEARVLELEAKARGA